MILSSYTTSLQTYKSSNRADAYPPEACSLTYAGAMLRACGRHIGCNASFKLVLPSYFIRLHLIRDSRHGSIALPVMTACSFPFSCVL